MKVALMGEVKDQGRSSTRAHQIPRIHFQRVKGNRNFLWYLILHAYPPLMKVHFLEIPRNPLQVCQTCP